LLGPLGGRDVTPEERKRGDLAALEDRTDDVETPLIDDRRVDLERGRDTVAKRLVECRLHHWVKPGLDEVEWGRLADELFSLDSRRRVVDEDVPVAPVDDDDEVERVQDDRTPPSLGVSKLRFERMPRSRVGHQRDRALRAVGWKIRWTDPQRDEDLRPVARQERQIQIARFAAQRSGQRSLVGGAIAIGDVRERRARPDQLTLFETHQPAELLVDLAMDALRVDQHQPIGQIAGEFAKGPRPCE
jgi:hypothetical protein